jgi:secretion/DNA translocation related TadE-like protein
MCRRSLASDAGSSGVMSIGIVGGVISLTAAVLLAAGALITLSRAQNAVDDAALVAADTASGRLPGYPCESARRVVEEADFALTSCGISGSTARVVLRVVLVGCDIMVRAMAGPPPTN